MLAAQQVTLLVTHIPADSSSCFLLGRQLPWRERNARTLPRETWASLSTDSQRADSRAVHGVRTGPVWASSWGPSPAWRAKAGMSVSTVLWSSPCRPMADVAGPRAEVAGDRILPASPDSGQLSRMWFRCSSNANVKFPWQPLFYLLQPRSCQSGLF